MWIYSLLIGIWMGYYTLLMMHYARAWKKLTRKKLPEESAGLPGLSVIIPFRNEQENVESLFRSLEIQDHPEIEFLLIDDGSEDSSFARLQELTAGDTRFRLLQSSGTGKKKAIREGIRESRYDHLLFSDADTTRGEKWARSMHNRLVMSRASFVSGPVQLTGGKGFFGRWQELEFSGLIAIGAAAIETGRPNMCNGANILYTRQCFEEVGGFAGNEDHPGGDDQFIMHKVFHKNPEQVVFHADREAIVYTEIVSSLKGFILQRVRWASKNGRFERKGVNREMLAVWIVNAILIAGIFLFPFRYMLLYPMLAGWIWKGTVEYVFYRDVLPFFRMQQRTGLFAFSVLTEAAYVFVIGLLGKFVSYEWKGRRHK